MLKRIALVLVLVVAIGVAGFGSYWHYAGPEKTCLNCHEIRPAHNLWSGSSHRSIKCEACHGSSLTNGVHSLWENGRRVVNHFAVSRHDDLRLSEEQIVDMIQRCKGCHEREFADWTASGHSARYSDIFLHPGHNQTEQLNSDCLRCHGMFYEGTIDRLVTPISTTGPWRLLESEQGPRPAIPCLACHQMHAKGTIAKRPDYSNPKTIGADRSSRLPQVGFYDRRERLHFDMSLLPVPRFTDLEFPVRVSADLRQRVCSQCHAHVAFNEPGSDDDRTPRGVHEGLSCLSCHAMHSLDARHSCAGCHPRLSNCGLDVEKMDTTFRSPGSEHNIHFVACLDCHPKGVPQKKAAAISQSIRAEAKPSSK